MGLCGWGAAWEGAAGTARWGKRDAVDGKEAMGGRLCGGSTGLSGWVGRQLGGLASLPTWAMVALVCLSVTFLTEVTSNTATTTILMPILASVCVDKGIDPLTLMLPAALSASCAFMLPVATAPNAIVFGTGRVKMGDMVTNGVVINLLGVVVITLSLMLF